MRKLLTMLMLTLMLWEYASAEVHNLGTFGNTYPIAEPDALAEIEKRAGETDWSKVFAREKWEERVKHFMPQDLVSLPRAELDRSYLVDLTYTLPFDIPDGKGGILYPKGYAINPLDHIEYPKVLVVIDGSDTEQVKWFSASSHAQSLKTTLLITEGSYYELAKKFNRPVFYLTRPLAERLKLERVPAVVRQKGRYMEVSEIAVKKNSSND